MSNRLNRAVTADAVDNDDDSHYNRQNGQTVEDYHQLKKNAKFHLLQYLTRIRNSHTQ
jgi:hypothetical protein